MTDEQREELVRHTNRLSLELTASLARVGNGIAERHGAINGLTVVFDAALTAAVALMHNAAMAGVCPRDDAVIRKRLDYILSLEERLHEVGPDGSVGPAQTVQ
jgi:hypothetical protein